MKIKGRGKAEPLTKRQFQLVLSQLSGHHSLCFALSWYTAERPGAILKLRTDDVFSVKGYPRKEIIFRAETRKDKRGRACPVHPELQAILKAYPIPDNLWLFPSPSNALQPMGFSTYDKALRSVFKGLEMEGYSPYSARRGALTLLMQSGLNPRQIQRISGHASLNSLQNYLEVSEAEVEAGIRLL